MTETRKLAAILVSDISATPGLLGRTKIAFSPGSGPYVAI